MQSSRSRERRERPSRSSRSHDRSGKVRGYAARPSRKKKTVPWFEESANSVSALMPAFSFDRLTTGRRARLTAKTVRKRFGVCAISGGRGCVAEAHLRTLQLLSFSTHQCRGWRKASPKHCIHQLNASSQHLLLNTLIGHPHLAWTKGLLSFTPVAQAVI